jgi:hypothetical protein
MILRQFVLCEAVTEFIFLSSIYVCLFAHKHVSYNILRMKWQFAVTHTICQTEISAFLDGLQTHIHSKHCAHKKLLVIIFSQKHNMLSAGLLTIGPIFVSCKTVYQ